MATIELYTIPGCPYCRRVRSKLDELGLEYEEHRVAMRHSKRDEVAELSGQTGVPVIVDRDHGVEGMAESSDIIRYLDETYGE